MPEVTLTLAGSAPETPTVRSFLFTPDPFVEYRPGQYLMLRLDVTGDPRGASRTFTISSSPKEGRDLMVTTRVVGRSPFKDALASLPVGAKAKGRAPMGTFTLHEDTSLRAVFVAAGIGVTPFRSMARFAAHERLPMDILLLYSARTPEEIVFREDLRDLARKNPRFRVVITVTRPQESKETWTGPTGRIDAEFLRRHADPLDDAVVYVAGPLAAVAGILDTLAPLGVPKERTRAERFTGY